MTHKELRKLLRALRVVIAVFVLCMAFFYYQSVHGRFVLHDAAVAGCLRTHVRDRSNADALMRAARLKVDAVTAQHFRADAAVLMRLSKQNCDKLFPRPSPIG